MTTTSMAVASVEAADLGDARRTKRLVAVVDSMTQRPSLSFPQLFNEAELEGAYRLMSNESVLFDDILDAQYKTTAERSNDCDVTLVLHDTTEFSFSLRDDVYREHLSQLTSRRQGFYFHASVAVSGDGERRPLGMVAARPYVHLSGIEGNDDAYEFWRDRDGIFDNENDRWFQSVEAAEASLEGADTTVIHVADREGDSYEFLASMVALKRRFVVRLNQDRCTEGDENKRVRARLQDEPFFDEERDVDLSPRSATRSAKEKKTHPARQARTATLSFRTVTLNVKRPVNATYDHYLPETITLTAVEALERNPPPGQEPVQWILLTTEPCANVKDAFRVVDWYRARWVVEEFFKAVKTGCRYEERQFETAHALLNMLAGTLPVAVQLLAMRHASRSRPDDRATTVMSPQLLVLLGALVPKSKINGESTVHEALMAVARLGGHLKRNGPPGWLVLYRGYVRLRDAHEGWLAMERMKKCDQS